MRVSTGNQSIKAPLELNQESLFSKIRTSCYRPFQLLLLEPMCLNLCTFSALLLGILYLFFGAFELVFKNVYGMNLWQIGMSFTGIFIGEVLAVVSNPFWSWYWRRMKTQAKGRTSVVSPDVQEDMDVQVEPEWRLPPGTYLPKLGRILIGRTY